MTKELNHIEAFIQAQKEMTTPVFNTVNPFHKNKYADLGAISASCLEALLNNDLTPIVSYGFVEGEWGIITKIVYKDLKEVGSGGFYIIDKTLNDQKKGSSTTYGKRYSLSMACNRIADADDDGNATSKDTPKEKPKWNGPIQRSKFSDAVVKFNKELSQCMSMEEFTICKHNNKSVWDQINLDTPKDAKLTNPDCTSGETTGGHIKRLHHHFTQVEEMNNMENK